MVHKLFLKFESDMTHTVYTMEYIISHAFEMEIAQSAKLPLAIQNSAI